MASHALGLPEPRKNRVLDVDALNANGGVILAMTAHFARVVTTPTLEHLDLGSAPVIHHFRCDSGPGKIGSSDFAFCAADHQHLVQRNFASGLNRKLFHNYFGTFFDAVLFSAGLDNRVHINLQKEKGIFAPQADKCQVRFAEYFAKPAKQSATCAKSENTQLHYPQQSFSAMGFSCPCAMGCLLLSVSAMNAATSLITVDITSLSHDGRGIARLAPADGQGRGTVVFVAHALPGQRVVARVTRSKSSFIEAEKHDLLCEAPDAATPICPHHADCGGCPLQTMPYERQLFWKRTIALDSLSRIGGLDRTRLESLLGPVAASPAPTRFRNKMEFAFGPEAAAGAAQGGELRLGLRRRNGRDVVAVPDCALVPAEALHMVSMVGDLAAKSGLAAYVPPDTRPDFRADSRPGTRPNTRPGTDPRKNGGRNHPRGQARRTPSYYSPKQETAAPGFWRFFVVRRGLAADLRTPRWWALCITSPGDTHQRAIVRALGREVLAAFPQLAAFIHEERATADAFAFGEKRVQTLDATGNENPGAARLFQPLNGSFFALDAASFFQVNTAAAQVLARTASSMLAPAKNTEAVTLQRGLLDLYCGVGAPGLLLADDYAALLGLEQDRKAVKLAKINAASHGQRQCQYEAGDAALQLERLAACDAQEMWTAIRAHAPNPAGTADTDRSDTHESEPSVDEGHIHPAVTDALVDPPRAGLSPRALDALLRIAPERIIYISCNPSTLARDAAHICKHYTLEALSAVDLFPHTPHLECVSLWRKG